MGSNDVDVIKQIIEERAKNLLDPVEKEDLDYVDLFYPKIELLIGAILITAFTATLFRKITK